MMQHKTIIKSQYDSFFECNLLQKNSISGSIAADSSNMIRQINNKIMIFHANLRMQDDNDDEDDASNAILKCD